MRSKFILAICLSLLLVTSCDILPGANPAPTAAPSPEQISGEVIKQVNDFLFNFDPVGFVIDAKIQAVDAAYEVKEGNALTRLYISVNCQGLCSRERIFSITMLALKNKYGPLRAAALPDTLKEVVIATLIDMKSTGSVTVKWKEANEYFTNIITGAQLASRIERSP